MESVENVESGGLDEAQTAAEAPDFAERDQKGSRVRIFVAMAPLEIRTFGFVSIGISFSYKSF